VGAHTCTPALLGIPLRESPSPRFSPLGERTMTKPIRRETPRLGMRFSDDTEGPRQKPKPRPRPFWYVSRGGASCGHRHRTLRAASHCPYPGEIKEGRAEP